MYSTSSRQILVLVVYEEYYTLDDLKSRYSSRSKIAVPLYNIRMNVPYFQDPFHATINMTTKLCLNNTVKNIREHYINIYGEYKYVFINYWPPHNIIIRTNMGK